MFGKISLKLCRLYDKAINGANSLQGDELCEEISSVDEIYKFVDTYILENYGDGENERIKYLIKCNVVEVLYSIMFETGYSKSTLHENLSKEKAYIEELNLEIEEFKKNMRDEMTGREAAVLNQKQLEILCRKEEGLFACINSLIAMTHKKVLQILHPRLVEVFVGENGKMGLNQHEIEYLTSIIDVKTSDYKILYDLTKVNVTNGSEKKFDLFKESIIKVLDLCEKMSEVSDEELFTDENIILDYISTTDLFKMVYIMSELEIHRVEERELAKQQKMEYCMHLLTLTVESNYEETVDIVKTFFEKNNVEKWNCLGALKEINEKVIDKEIFIKKKYVQDLVSIGCIAQLLIKFRYSSKIKPEIESEYKKDKLNNINLMKIFSAKNIDVEKFEIKEYFKVFNYFKNSYLMRYRYDFLKKAFFSLSSVCDANYENYICDVGNIFCKTRQFIIDNMRLNPVNTYKTGIFYDKKKLMKIFEIPKLLFEGSALEIPFVSQGNWKDRTYEQIFKEYLNFVDISVWGHSLTEATIINNKEYVDSGVAFILLNDLIPSIKMKFLKGPDDFTKKNLVKFMTELNSLEREYKILFYIMKNIEKTDSRFEKCKLQKAKRSNSKDANRKRKARGEEHIYGKKSDWVYHEGDE